MRKFTAFISYLELLTELRGEGLAVTLLLLMHWSATRGALHVGLAQRRLAALARDQLSKVHRARRRRQRALLEVRAKSKEQQQKQKTTKTKTNSQNLAAGRIAGI